MTQPVDLTSWLPNLLGPVTFQVNGVAQSVPKRLTINFKTANGQGFTVTDNPANNSTDLTFAPAPSVAVPAMSIDWSAGGVFSKTLAAGANTFTFANASDGQTIVVRVTGAASTLTWPTVKWAGGTAPTQTASGTDVYTFVNIGGTIYGSVVQAMA